MVRASRCHSRATAEFPLHTVEFAFEFGVGTVRAAFEYTAVDLTFADVFHPFASQFVSTTAESAEPTGRRVNAAAPHPTVVRGD